MATRRRSAIVVGFLAPALACTAVTGLGKSYEYVDDGGAITGDASSADSPSGHDGAKTDAPPMGTPCPALIGGAYSMSSQGDCTNTFDRTAKECISPTMSVVTGNCSLQFISPISGVTNSGGVNGTLDAQSDMSFKNGILTVGTIKRAGCVATFRALPPTVTVTCPSDGGGNACVITMGRTAPTCL